MLARSGAMTQRLDWQRFLRSRPGSSFLKFVCFCLLLSAGVGYGTYALGLSWYTANKSEEKITALQLVDAFVTNYSDLRSRFGGDAAPVPASFRAHSIELFNQMRDADDGLRLLWVGRPDRAIATPPADPAMAETIEAFAREPNPKAVSSFITTAAGLVFRTVYPSIAAQQSCVDCHNALQPHLQWHLNDVMGAFSIDVPAGPFLRANLLQSGALGLVIFLALGGTGLLLAVQSFRQLTERELGQARLKESEERFRDFAEASSDWFWEQDENLRFIALSDPVEKSGLSIEAHIGKTRREVVFYGVTEEQWRAHQADLDARRAFHDFRFQRLSPAGELRHISVSGRPVFDGAGKFRGYRGTARDVTEEQAANEALRRAKEDAETASRAKSDFLATMSHELRTPLNAVIGFSEMMLREIHGALHKRYRGYAGDIYESGQHLLNIINDILDLSKAEAGKLELVEVALDARAAIENACRLVHPRAEDAGLTLTTSIPADLPHLRADERIFKQILLNLLSNAVKFTPAHGHIEVSAATDEHGGLTVAVRDSGIGMTPEHVKKALEPFGQVDSSLSRRHDGTGLGLPLAAAMVERHGGALRLHSVLGRGTTAVLTFPRERVVAPSAVA
jgi:PAS domain S-box-containing protein